MTLYNISRVDQLFNTLDKCKGEVELVTPNGKRLNWKENHEVLESMWSAMPDNKIEKIEVYMERGDDALNIMDYLIRGAIA